jgi:hypothetical protein
LGPSATVFFDLTKTAPAPIAEEALRRIARLYAIEADPGALGGGTPCCASGPQPPSGRGAQRLARVAAWARLGQIQDRRGHPLRAQPVDRACAVPYNGRVEIDSNTVERSIRPLALNSKNSLFAGHDRGAENWALIASLIETCKLHGVNPETYLTDVLTRLVEGWPNARLAELTPWAWAAAQTTQTALAA